MTGGVGVAGLLVVMATAAVVPDMQLAASVGMVFTVVLLASYAMTRRRRRATADPPHAQG